MAIIKNISEVHHKIAVDIWNKILLKDYSVYLSFEDLKAQVKKSIIEHGEEETLNNEADSKS